MVEGVPPPMKRVLNWVSFDTSLKYCFLRASKYSFFKWLRFVYELNAQ